MGYLHIDNLYKNQTILLFKEAYCMEKIHGCLRSDSIINMSDGSTKAIKDIKKGDMVRSYDEANKVFVDKKVKGIVIQEITEHLNWHKLTLDNGSEIICTEDHPILTTIGWVEAKNINSNHDIIYCPEKLIKQ